MESPDALCQNLHLGNHPAVTVTVTVAVTDSHGVAAGLTAAACQWLRRRASQAFATDPACYGDSVTR